MKSLVISRLSTGAAGDTALWALPANKRFQLLGFTVQIAPGSTTVGGSAVLLRDGIGGAYLGYLTFVQVAANPTVLISTTDLPGDGYISNADANSLVVNLSAALTAGGVQVTCWGYEI